MKGLKNRQKKKEEQRPNKPKWEQENRGDVDRNSTDKKVVTRKTGGR
jgi:hypothetical protein